MSRASMWVRGVLLLTVLMAGLTEAGWLEDFSQSICRKDIRCYSKTYYCSRLLNVDTVQQAMVQVLAYCYSLLGSSTLRPTQITADDLFSVMTGAHGQQLPDCILVQMGLVVNGEVNQAALYLSLGNTVISVNRNQQEAFLDGISSCPEPTKSQLLTFGMCVIQSCVSAL